MAADRVESRFVLIGRLEITANGNGKGNGNYELQRRTRICTDRSLRSRARIKPCGVQGSPSHRDGMNRNCLETTPDWRPSRPGGMHSRALPTQTTERQLRSPGGRSPFPQRSRRSPQFDGALTTAKPVRRLRLPEAVHKAVPAVRARWDEERWTPIGSIRVRERSERSVQIRVRSSTDPTRPPSPDEASVASRGRSQSPGRPVSMR